MEKINNFKEALEALKQNFILIDEKRFIYYFFNEKIIVSKNGSRFLIKEKDFLKLYDDHVFYYFENNEFALDEQKDIEYYSLKHK